MLERLGLVPVVALALALWLPRLAGPLDMRYDAGVYYVLGSALAEGKGYRLLNEPGEIHAVQYPPFLPLAAAAAQRLAGGSGVSEAGHLLRLAFFLISLLYGVGAYRLGCRFLGPALGVLVALVALLHVHTTSLSDLFFAELPFALVSVAFVLAMQRADRSRSRSLLAGSLAVAAYLLRTMGLALLAAWIGEALLRRRWATVRRRTIVALLPVLAWQGYVASVEAGPEYEHPAYPYQRADYQYYNVGYLENVAYIDPFHPELGKASAEDWARRVGANVARIPASWGESVSAMEGWWKDLRYELGRRARRLNGAAGNFAGAFAAILSPAIVAVHLLGWLVILGLVHLVRKGEPLVPLYVAAYTLLASLTPWPQQFLRYFQPLAPFLAIAAFLLLTDAWRAARARRAGGRRAGPFAARALLLGIWALVALGLTVETYSQLRLWKNFYGRAAYVDASGEPHAQRLFFYQEGWRSYEGALAWLHAHAAKEEVVATQAPQWTYLWTGRKSVFPPAETDTAEAQRLLDAVPAAYLVLDELEFDEVSAREAAAVVRAHPERWRLAYESPDAKTRVYRRLESAGVR